MLISELSIRRPVLATVASLLLIVCGIAAFLNLPLRELPDVDPPVVSVGTAYRGAAAAIIETRITRIIEDAISGIEGIETIASSSDNGRSSVTVQFALGRDLEAATNDVRDAISRVSASLPADIDPPQVAKVDADAQPVLWLNFASDRLDALALSDYAERHLVDRLSTMPGVASVTVGGRQRYAMRIWLSREALAARGLTVSDVVAALRRENVELPAGMIEAAQRDFSVRIDRSYRSPEQFAQLPMTKGRDGHIVRLGEVARIELGATDRRNLFRGNGRQQVGLGVIKQSTANTVTVAQAVRAETERIAASLPEDMHLVVAFDSSVFIDRSIREVWFTLAITVALVIGVIYLFLGSWRAALIPAVTIPVCVVATFIGLYAFDFSINLITLLALVLCIGLVVDDAIVVLENCQRRVDLGEPPLVAAQRGTRQVAFAVIATTAVLVSVFLPIAFLKGNLGVLFRELGVALSTSVAVSGLVALSLSAMLCSKLLVRSEGHTGLARWVDTRFRMLEGAYRRALEGTVRRVGLLGAVVLGAVAASVGLYVLTPKELTPPEDQGNFFISVNGPEGAGFDYTVEQALAVEAPLMRAIDEGLASRVIVRAPRGMGGATSEDMHTAMAILFLAPWGERPPAFEIQRRLQAELDQIPGVRAQVTMRTGLQRGGGGNQPVQFVIGGPDYATLAQWQDKVLRRAEQLPGLIGVDSDYKETRPQLRVAIDRQRAADLGVSVQEIGSTLETMLGSRRVTTFERAGEEYDVMLQAERADRSDPSDLANLYVRSERSGELVPLGNLVALRELADSGELDRFNRIRSITIQARLAPGYSLGQALADLEQIAREELPAQARIDYRGESRDYRAAGSDVLLTFALAMLVVYLVLAAQFESFVHPFVIMLTVPLAVLGALLALFGWGQLAPRLGATGLGATLNLYSQVGIVILIGIATKNGILIVEFANQLRDAGRSIHEAVLEASVLRLRPILMTSIATAIGALPLALASGAGSNSRFTIGLVIVAGVSLATVLTLFVVPAFYRLLAGYTRSPEALSRQIEALDRMTPTT
ncbi:MAG: efflux RND transporter permease subunit [Xanthomonadales bacterium PRO6]|nr:Multidrug export protein AcrF [Xanthomonadales bacterium]MCE7931270.1 efflux RND transporter permease subunit [Xanthomonadales bacterium PRO6]